MAVSLEGVFIILDRATGPMRRMERQAQQTDRAFAALGARMDRVATPAQARGYDRNTQALRNMGREAEIAERDVTGLGRSVSDADTRTQRLTTSLRRTGGAFAGLRALMKPAIWTGMATGIGVLLQAVGALAGGLVALVPRLVDAAKAGAVIPSAFAGAIQAFGALKLATYGVTNAIQAGVTAQTMSSRQALSWANQQRSAAEAVASSHYTLTQAQQSETLAQKALTQAREDARRELVDMALAARGAALSEQRATLTLRQAQDNLQQVRRRGGSTMLEQRDAALSVKEAHLGLHEAQVQANRAQEDSNKVHRQGVSRMDQVESASRGLASAQHSVKEAVQGLNDAQRQQNELLQSGSTYAANYQQALSQLSPAAQSFVRYIISLRPQLQDLRAAAASAFFPGVQRGIESAMSNLGRLRHVVVETAGAFGTIAEKFGEFLGRRGVGRDFSAIGDTNARVFSILGDALIHVADGFRHLMVAAQPFTLWIARTLRSWAEWFDRTQRVNRQTGATADMFDRARSALELFGSIVSHLWGALTGIGRAARGLGDDLWNSADSAAKRWDQWANSVQGQGTLTAYFDSLSTNLHALFKLVGELGKAIALMGADPGLSRTADALAQAVDPLRKAFSQIANTLGPRIADIIVQIADLFAHLSGGALGRFLDLIDNLLQALNWLIDHVPIIGGLIQTALGVGLVIRFTTFLRGLTDQWGILAVTATRAGIAQREALAASGGGGTFITAPGGGGAIFTGTTGAGAASEAEAVAAKARAAGAGRLLISGAFPGAAGTAARAEIGARGGVLGTLGGGLTGLTGGLRTAEGGLSAASVGGGLLKGGGALLGGAARFLGPIGLALSGLMGLQGALSTEGGFGRKLQGAGSALTFGLIHQPLSKEELYGQGQTSAQETLQSGIKLRDLTAQIRNLKQQAASADEFDLAQVQGQLDVLQDAHKAMAAQRGTNMVNSFFGGQTPDAAFGQMLDAAKKNGGSVIDQMTTVANVSGRELARLPASARQDFIDLYQSWLQQQAKNHPEIRQNQAKLLRTMAGQYGELGKNVRVVNGKIVDDSHKTWHRLVMEGRSAVERIAEQRDKLTPFQHELRAFLRNIGASVTLARQLTRFDFSPSQARRVAEGATPQALRQWQRQFVPGGAGPSAPALHMPRLVPPHHRFQAGGVVPGAGGWGDTVPAMLEPGEIVLSRGMRQRAEGMPHSLGARIDRTPLRDVGDRGKREIGDATRDWTKLMTRGMADTLEPILDTGKQTRDDFDKTRGFVSDSTKQSGDYATRQWQGLRDHMRDANADMASDTRQKFGQITDELRKALSGLGLKGPALANAMSGAGGGGQAGGGGAGGGGRRGHARGGRVGGRGLDDSVPLGYDGAVAPGELIVNRHTERRVDRVLGMLGTSLGMEVGREGRPHNLRGYATGGRASSGPYRFPLAGNYGWGRVDQGVDFSGTPTVGAIGAGRVIRTGAPGWPGGGGGVLYQLTAGAPRGFSPSSNVIYAYESIHPTVSAGQRLSAGQAIGHEWAGGGSTGIEMGWATPSGGTLAQQIGDVDPVSHHSSAGESFYRFLKALEGGAGVAGGAKGLLGPPPKLRRVRGYGGPGTARQAGSQRALDNYLAAAQGVVNRHAGGVTGTVPIGPIQQMAHQLVRQRWGEGQWPPFVSLEMSEAGWDPKVQNASSGAAGLAQALPPSKYPPGAWPYQGPQSARLQLEWMMGYIANTYGTPAGAWAFHQANNWYGAGTDFVADRPQVIGVGDGGRERVRVTPIGRGVAGRSGTAGPIQVRIDTINVDYRGEGDARDAIKREVGQAFRELADELHDLEDAEGLVD